MEGSLGPRPVIVPQHTPQKQEEAARLSAHFRRFQVLLEAFIDNRTDDMSVIPLSDNINIDDWSVTENGLQCNV
ncbi:hypothetical protein H0H87_012252, partial [Tephrocybe sp. NHM501043]